MKAMIIGGMLLAGLTTGATVPACAGDTISIEQALADLNVLARAHYATAKAATLTSLSPVIVAEPDALTLLHNGERRREVYLPEHYRSLKALAHVALGLAALAELHADKPDFAAWRAELATYRAQVAALAPRIGEIGLHWDDAKRQRQMLASTLAFMDSIAAAGGVTTAALKAYTTDVGPALQGNLYDASDVELKSLDAVVTRWRGELAPEEWQRLYVVVLGPGRPRERHPPYDYFARLFGPEGQTRLITAENVTDVDAALDLLATTVTDRRLAAFFFDDPAQIERGLMRPSTARHLDQMFAR